MTDSSQAARPRQLATARIEEEADADSQDEALARALSLGDVKALEILYQRYARPIFSLAFRILGNEADAEETMQDVLERAWRRSTTFDPARGRFGSWILGMAHHVAIDALRKRHRRPQSIDSQAAEQVVAFAVADDADVAETVIQHEEATRVRAALQALPEAQQQMIELAFFKGLSHGEIAAATGEPLGTVKTRIRRGMERLRMALSNETPGDTDAGYP